jgi:methylmalonyl-CoA/ethylmalonyl-CoA epimerase
MVTQLDHVGIYVEDIEAAVRFWRDVVGLECTEISEHPETGHRLAHVCVNGVELELIEAAVENTMLRHMPHRGPGIYHVGLRTDDLEGAVARLRDAGVRMLDESPRTGQGMRVQFAAPDGLSQGVMIELVDRLRPGPADRTAVAARRERG